MREVLIKEYNNTSMLSLPFKEPKNSFNIHFVNGAFCEILGPDNKEYDVIFKNNKTGKIHHQTTIKNNMWTKTGIQYFIEWKVEIYEKDSNILVYEYLYNAKNKRVYIHLDSGALGDTLAWFPYIEEFRKKWDCEMVVSTFHNDWFESKYPNLHFVNPGDEVVDLYAMYGLGWFYDDQKIDEAKSPIDFKKYPLQQTATELLGLEYKEVKPILHFNDKGKQIDGDYVVIAPHASAHAKYWMYPKGWQTVINYLNANNYKVVMLTQEPLGDEWHDSKLGGTLTNVINKTGNLPLEDRINDIKYAKLFIGVGSGLSWLSWAMNTPTIMISGFSYPYTEFQDCERIFNDDSNICGGCFNRHWLNPGDWEWCPDHQNTPRHFECTKTIPPSQVINSINKLLCL
jgi:autotransporter strand-loop-strand O-heptosyltransferase